MTRINCIPVDKLSRLHLIAEYRELPRVFALVRAFDARGGSPEQLELQGYLQEYRLGKGHVKFFYNKLLWLSWRHIYLVNEMVNRGYSPSFTQNLRAIHDDIPSLWWGNWEPTEEAKRINWVRILERGGDAP